MKTQRAVIVGGGIAGPVLAMWLRRLGMDAVVVERRAASAKGEGAFLGVAPNGMNVLRSLGIEKQVEARGFPCTGFQFENAAGRPIGTIDRSADRAEFGAALTMIRRGDLHDVLMEEAARSGAQLKLGANLVAIDRSDPRRVTARFEDGSDQMGDLLIACDGLRSTTRTLVLPDAPAPAFSGLWDFGGFAPNANVKVPFAPGVNQMVFGKRAFFGAFVTAAQEIWWFHNGPRGDARDLRGQLLELHRDDSRWIRDVLEATPEVLGPWPLYDLPPMRRWADGRVCLIGDAAHAMSPSAGQGASLAMEDAMQLAICLRDNAEPTEAFAAFDRLRRKRVTEIFHNARRSSSGKAIENRAALWFRDRMLPFFLRMGGKAQSRSYAFKMEWDGTSASTPGRAAAPPS